MCRDEAFRKAHAISNLLSGNTTTRYVVDTTLHSEDITPNRSDGLSTMEYETRYTSTLLQKMLQHEGLNATLHNVASTMTIMMQNVSGDTITGQVGRAGAFVQV